MSEKVMNAKIMPLPKRKVRLAYSKVILKEFTTNSCQLKVEIGVPKADPRYDPQIWLRFGSGTGYVLIRWEDWESLQDTLQALFEGLFEVKQEVEEVLKEQVHKKWFMETMLKETENVWQDSNKLSEILRVCGLPNISPSELEDIKGELNGENKSDNNNKGT